MRSLLHVIFSVIFFFFLLPAAGAHYAGTPFIKTSGVPAVLTAQQGTASSSTNFEVSGTNLTAGILVTAPAGFEAGVDNISFSNTITVGKAGTLAPTWVYLRLKAGDIAGTYSGNVVLSSPGATGVNVPAATSWVTDAPAGLTRQFSSMQPGPPADQTVANGGTVTGVDFDTTCTYNWFNDNPSIGLPLTGTGNIASFTAVNTGTTPIVATITATPVQTNYAYIANRIGNSVTIIDVTAQSPVKTIPLGNGPTAVATSADGLKVYVSSGGENKVYIIDTKTNTVEPQAIMVGNGPSEMALSPDGSKLYVANSGSNTVSVVNTATNMVITNILTDQQPDATPTGVAISPDGSKLYVTNYGIGTVSVINTATNTVTASIPVGVSPRDVIVSHNGQTVYVDNFQSQTLSVISAAINTVRATVQFDAGPEGMALSPDGSLLYVSLTFEDVIQIVGALSNTLMNRIQLTSGAEPLGIAFTKDGSKVYAVNQRAPITVISTTTQMVTGSIDDGSAPVNGSSGSAGFGDFMSATSCSTVSFRITVNPESAPGIIAGGTLAALTTTQGTASASTQFSVSGTSLTAGILVTPPPGFEVSVDNVNFSPTVTVGTGGNISATTVYVRLGNTDLPGSYSGNIALSSPGAPNAYEPTAISTVTPAVTPAITAAGTLQALTTTQGTASASTQFSVSGTNLTAGILVTPPPGFEVSVDNVNFSPTVTVGTGGTVSATPVYIRLGNTDLPGSYGGNTNNIVLTSPGAASVNEPTAISTVNPLLATTPVITVTGALSPLTTVYGTPSTSTTFTVSGANLTSKVTITPPAGFEVSTDDVTFSPAVNVTAGNAPVTVFVRLAATAPAGSYSPHNIVLTSPGAAGVNEATANSTVNPAPLTITADDKGKIVGQDNPQLTVTYTGFVNGEQPANLTTLPVTATTATTASPAGHYPITVSGAKDPDYAITYVAGVLTVSPVPPPISIPNAFTPNNDGVNDTWNLKNIEKFPHCVVNIYNRYGANVFLSVGYGIPWDGKYKGTNLPGDVYYYIINPQDGSPLISGNVTIIR